MDYEIIKFEDDNVELEVNVSPEEETVWLTKDQIATLFDRDRTVADSLPSEPPGKERKKERCSVVSDSL